MAYTTIDDPSAHFQTALYTGNGSTGQNITNDGNSDLQPDWVWAKRRDADTSHGLVDSSRGVRKVLSSNGTSAEVAESAGNTLTAFLSDGFTVGDDGNYTAFNANGSSIVAWQWKANGGSRTTFSSSGNQLAGGYQANTTAGFSIVDYTGNATNGATFPHGLGATPTIAIIKDRTNAGDGGGTNWIVVSTAQDGSSDRLYLNGNNTKYDLSGTEFRADFDSSNVTLGTWNNVNASGTHIAYVFTPIQGYSKIGSYTGNQSTDGPFLYFGFKPAFLMVKKTSSAENWFLIDNKRHPINDGQIPRVIPNNSDAESEDASIAGDFLSNGFKIRATQNMINESGTYIYMAFAEHPFVSSEGVPTTAR